MSAAATPPFLPYGRQAIDDDDLAAVREALTADMLTTGPLVERFEQALGAATGAAHAVVCSSGTAALHLAARAIGLKPGDAVIVPSITFVATANAARYCGAEVVFADVDPASGLMTPATLAAALARAPAATRAVFPVHMAGLSCDMEAIAALARPRGLKIVEDACHALGGADGAASVGACAFSDLACFSFHPVKTVAMGEGGAITTNDAALAEAMRRDRSHGLVREAEDLTLPDAFDENGAPNPWFYELHEPGFNYRAPDILCALGLSQLSKLTRFVAARRALAQAYAERLAPLAPLVTLAPDAPGHARHLLVARIDFAAAGLSRADLMRRLKADGIGTQVHYIPVHRQPYYARHAPAALPGADAWYAACLSLPLFVGMTQDDVARVADALTRALSG